RRRTGPPPGSRRRPPSPEHACRARAGLVVSRSSQLAGTRGASARALLLLALPAALLLAALGRGGGSGRRNRGRRRALGRRAFRSGRLGLLRAGDLEVRAHLHEAPHAALRGIELAVLGELRDALGAREDAALAREGVHAAQAGMDGHWRILRLLLRGGAGDERVDASGVRVAVVLALAVAGQRLHGR